MTKKALGAKKLLCDNNTVKTRCVNWSDVKKELAFQTRSLVKNNSFCFQQSLQGSKGT